MDILIVGAGIGGLALAALLKQRGIKCRVVERSGSLEHAGYMLTLYPMGNRVLHGLGKFEEFVKRSSSFKTYEVHNGQGDLLHRFDVSVIGSEFGYTGQLLRKDLLEILRSAAPDVPLRMGTGLEHLEQRDGRVNVRFSDGSTGVFDAVVGADGIHSKTRRIIFGEEPDHETGWGLWVWWSGVDLPRDTVREYWGKGRFVGLYPTPSVVGAVAAGPRHLLGPDVIDGDGLRVRELFSGMGGGAAEIMNGFPAKTDDLFFWNLSDYRTHRWTSGRIALLGDSACAFLPTAGVGASMALESAAVMADELTRTDARFIPQAFTLYEKRRRKRAELAQEDSRKLAVWMLADSAPLVWTRDQFMKVATMDSLVRNISHSLGEPI